MDLLPTIGIGLGALLGLVVVFKIFMSSLKLLLMLGVLGGLGVLAISNWEKLKELLSL